MPIISKLYEKTRIGEVQTNEPSTKKNFSQTNINEKLARHVECMNPCWRSLKNESILTDAVSRCPNLYLNLIPLHNAMKIPQTGGCTHPYVYKGRNP